MDEGRAEVLLGYLAHGEFTVASTRPVAAGDGLWPGARRFTVSLSVLVLVGRPGARSPAPADAGDGDGVPDPFSTPALLDLVRERHPVLGKVALDARWLGAGDPGRRAQRPRGRSRHPAQGASSYLTEVRSHFRIALGRREGGGPVTLKPDLTQRVGDVRHVVLLDEVEVRWAWQA